MHIGMNLPVMAPGLDREPFLAWCRAIDQGPFHTLAAGERVAFYNPDIIAALGAAAAVTRANCEVLVDWFLRDIAHWET